MLLIYLICATSFFFGSECLSSGGNEQFEQAVPFDPIGSFANERTWGPVFAPDGRTCYYFEADEKLRRHTIFASRLEGEKWSRPEVADFSGQFDDLNPCITPDGSQLFFISARETRRYGVWVMDRAGNGWGQPRNIGAPVNGQLINTSLCVTARGNLYLSSTRGGGSVQVYRSVPQGGGFGPPELLPPQVNAYEAVWGVWVNAAETLLVVATKAPTDSSIDLYFSTAENGVWTSLTKAGKSINSDDHGELWPRFSPDDKFILFNRAGGPTDGLYCVPVSELLDSRPLTSSR